VDLGFVVGKGSTSNQSNSHQWRAKKLTFVIQKAKKIGKKQYSAPKAGKKLTFALEKQANLVE